MKSSSLKFFILLFLNVGLIAGCSRLQLTPEQLVAVRDSQVQITEFSPPQTEVFTLPNGVKVYFAEDHEIPLVNCTVIFPRGSLARNDKQNAIYAALGRLARSGGTANISPDEFDRKLQDLSATVSVSIGSEFSTLGFSGLSGDLEKVSSLAFELWQSPGFDEERFSLWKSQSIESIIRRDESPDTVAAISLLQLLYKDSLLGDSISKQEVEDVKITQIQNLHKQIFSTDGMVVILSGALSKQQAYDLLVRFFEPLNFQTSPKDISTYQGKLPKPKPGIYFIKKPFQQAVVYMASLGPGRFTPDFAAIDVFNGIFGSNGEFSSMLVKEVRSNLGLSYSVVGGTFREEPIGRSFIGLQTKNESVGQAIQASLSVLRQIQKAEYGERLINDVKASTASSFVFTFDSLGAVAARKAFQDLLKYPSSFDDTYVDKIQSVTDSEIVEVASKYWDLDKFIVLVVGDETALQSLKSAKQKKWLPNLPLKEVKFKEQLLGF